MNSKQKEIVVNKGQKGSVPIYEIKLHLTGLQMDMLREVANYFGEDNSNKNPDYVHIQLEIANAILDRKVWVRD